MNVGVKGEGRPVNEATIQRAYEIIKSRANAWDEMASKTKTPQNCAFAVAYKSAQCILRAAIDGDTEVLNQYDDYRED